MAQDATRAVWGVGITMTGTLVQSCQYVYEEKVMSGDIQAPPWLLIGMEGGTGTLITIFIPLPTRVLGAGRRPRIFRERLQHGAALPIPFIALSPPLSRHRARVRWRCCRIRR